MSGLSVRLYGCAWLYASLRCLAFNADAHRLVIALPLIMFCLLDFKYYILFICYYDFGLWIIYSLFLHLESSLTAFTTFLVANGTGTSFLGP